MKFGIFFSLVVMLTFPAWSQTTDSTGEVAVSTAKVSEEVSDMVAAQSVQAAKSEDEIPVNFSKLKKAETADASNSRLFLTFGLLAVILGVGYFLAKKYGRPANAPQTKIKVLTQHYLGPKKSLAIVRVAGESILIGITDQNINMIKSLSLIDDEVPESMSNASFQETFNEKKEMTMDLTSARSSGNQTRRDVMKEGGEEFSIRHIKDVVSLKLKGMRGDI